MTDNPFLLETELRREVGESRRVDKTITLAERLGTDVIAVPAGGNLHLDLLLESVSDGVLVTGTLTGVLEGQCVRCLKTIDEEFDAHLTELYAYPDTLEGEEPAEDEDSIPVVEDGAIDLTDMVVDAVVLDLPFNPVCEEDCPGLCQEFGIPLAENPGHEHEAPVDPRWAALSELAGTDE